MRLKYLGHGFLALVFMIGTLAGLAGGFLKLPRFGGHLRIWEKGVHNGKESIFVPA